MSSKEILYKESYLNLSESMTPTTNLSKTKMYTKQDIHAKEILYKESDLSLSIYS